MEETQTQFQQVLNVFNEYYGEERVDVQEINGRRTIVIWFPTVRITNEHDRYADLTNLYIRVVVTDRGTLNGTFTMNRSECTAKQWTSDYYHSHLSGIPKGNLTEFRSTCLGSGPIKDTCISLGREFDLDLWGLFVYELDLYVHTESVEGVPYRHLEEIGLRRNGGGSYDEQLPITSGCCNVIIPDNVKRIFREGLIPYIISRKPFNFRYYNGKYSIATDGFNFILTLSNLFIEWYNSLSHMEQGTIREDLTDSGILRKCKIVDNRFIAKRANNSPDRSYESHIGRPLWMFKGQQVTFNVIDDYTYPREEDDDQYSYTIIDTKVAMRLKYNIERVINYRYGNRSISASEKVCYL